MKLALIGATGNIGRQILLKMENLFAVEYDIQQFDLFANSYRENFKVSDINYIINDIKSINLRNYNFFIFATESDISEKYIPTAIANGAICIDTSSKYRLSGMSELICTPVNGGVIDINKTKLYSVANCIASPISVALSKFKTLLKRIDIVSLQSVSGWGKLACEELHDQVYNNSEIVSYLPRKIAFNVVPQVDKFLDDGSTYEEYKICNEIKRIFNNDDLEISVTSIRVPVIVGHSMVVKVELDEDLSIDEIKRLLSNTTMVKISENEYSTALEVEGSDYVFVGRIRKDNYNNTVFHIWVCSDNLRRGASTDVIELFQKITSENVLKKEMICSLSQ